MMAEKFANVGLLKKAPINQSGEPSFAAAVFNVRYETDERKETQHAARIMQKSDSHPLQNSTQIIWPSNLEPSGDNFEDRLADRDMKCAGQFHHYLKKG